MTLRWAVLQPSFLVRYWKLMAWRRKRGRTVAAHLSVSQWRVSGFAQQAVQERVSVALRDRRVATFQGGMWLSSESLVGMWIGHNAYPSDGHTHKPRTQIGVQGRHIHLKWERCCGDSSTIFLQEQVKNSKGEKYWFCTSKSIYRSWGVLLHMGKKLYKGFYGFRGSWLKSDKSPQVMPLKSASFGSEDFKFENEKKSGGVEVKGSELTKPLQPTLISACGSWFKATLPATSLTHPNLRPNCHSVTNRQKKKTVQRESDNSMGVHCKAGGVLLTKIRRKPTSRNFKFTKMKTFREMFHYQPPQCIRDQWSHGVAVFQAEHSAQMDVNLMGSAHSAAERPASSSQSESMDGQRRTGARLRLAAEGPAVQNSRRKMSDAATSDSRYKNRRKRNVLTKWQITLTAATSSLRQRPFPGQ